MIFAQSPLLHQQTAWLIEDEDREGPVSQAVLVDEQLLRTAGFAIILIDQDEGFFHDADSAVVVTGQNG